MSAPADPPLTPVMLGGTAIWAAVGLVLVAAGAPAGWRWTCLAGVLLGVVLSGATAVRDRRRPDRGRPDRGRPDRRRPDRGAGPPPPAAPPGDPTSGSRRD